MIVKKIPIEKINPAEYNPRVDLKPGDPEYEKLKKSIERFDIVEPLIWNEVTGNLVGGHQRLKILQERGDKTVDVSVVHIENIKMEKALNVSLNKIQGDWDYLKLKDVFLDLQTDFDIGITGFDQFEIDSGLNQFDPTGLEPTGLEGTDMKGNTKENGRFIIVYSNNSEMEFIKSHLGIDGNKIVWMASELMAKQ